MDIIENSNVLEIVLRGNLDVKNYTEKKRKIIDYIKNSRTKDKNGKSMVIINLEHVEYIDSSGISLLIAINTHLKKNKGRLALIGVLGDINHIFRLTRLHHLFTIFDSKEEAVNYLI